VADAPKSQRELGQLKIELSREGQRSLIVMSGSADLRDSTPLAELLLEQDKQARATGVTQLDVDVRAVEFMNSSALNAFVRWFAVLKGHKEGYRVRFLSDPSKRWQRGSLNALATFAQGIVTIDAQPA
jgi:anti-anti-sigma regulatory factor